MGKDVIPKCRGSNLGQVERTEDVCVCVCVCVVLNNLIPGTIANITLFTNVAFEKGKGPSSESAIFGKAEFEIL